MGRPINPASRPRPRSQRRCVAVARPCVVAWRISAQLLACSSRSHDREAQRSGVRRCSAGQPIRWRTMPGISSSHKPGFPRSGSSMALVGIGLRTPRSGSVGTPLARMNLVTESKLISLATQAQNLDSMGGGRWGGSDVRSLIDQDGEEKKEWIGQNSKSMMKRKKNGARPNARRIEKGLLRWRLSGSGKSCVSAPPADMAAPWRVTTRSNGKRR